MIRHRAALPLIAVVAVMLGACETDGGTVRGSTQTPAIDASAPTGTQTEAPTPSPAGQGTCRSDADGFVVRYPADWQTNEPGEWESCRFFHPEPFDVPEPTPEFHIDPAIAVQLRFTGESFDSAVAAVTGAPDLIEVVEQEQTAVASRRALRVRWRAVAAVWGLPEDAKAAQYIVDVQARTLHITTPDTATAGTYEGNRAVLHQIAESLRLVPGGGSCSAAGEGLTEMPSEQVALPQAVAETRQAIFHAAVRCDYERLDELAGDLFTYSFGDGADFSAFLRRQEAAGRDPLRYLVELLDGPYAALDTPQGTQYVWPSAFAYDDWRDVPKDERDALEPLYDADDFAHFRQFGAYIGSGRDRARRRVAVLRGRRLRRSTSSGAWSRDVLRGASCGEGEGERRDKAGEQRLAGLPAVTIRTPSWVRPSIFAVGAVAAAAGFGQFGVTAALGDIATAFGEPSPTGGALAEVGMAGSRLGVGLALIRLASLGGLPMASLADRYGRRGVLLSSCAGGLALTVAAAWSPSFWWFVALFAAGRPLLAGAVAVAGVHVAEATSTNERASGVALVSAAYAIGTGLVALVRTVGLSFREVFAAALLPLLALPLLARGIAEPDPHGSAAAQAHGLPGAVPPRWRRRVSVVCAVHAAVGMLVGPVNSFVFLYGEQVLGLSRIGMTSVFISTGVTGLAGLLAGRWAADRLGRRITVATAVVVAAACAVAAYAGSSAALVIAFPLMVMAASAFAPAAGALDAELFPAEVRATAAGWLTASQVLGTVVGIVTVGTLVDALGSFTPAVAVIAAPVAASALLYMLVPETRGKGLETGEEPADDG